MAEQIDGLPQGSDKGQLGMRDFQQIILKENRDTVGIYSAILEINRNQKKQPVGQEFTVTYDD